jgi:hypothetical protein
MSQLIKIKDSRNKSDIFVPVMKQSNMYRDVEISEQQIEVGKIKEARVALREMRVKYGL